MAADMLAMALPSRGPVRLASPQLAVQQRKGDVCHAALAVRA
jgi:hypothetical protein